MVVNVLMVIGAILLVLSLCTLFAKSYRWKLFNTVVNALLMGDMFIVNIISGNYLMTIIFGMILVFDIVMFLFLVDGKDEYMNMDYKADKLSKKEMFLREIDQYIKKYDRF